MLTRVVMALVGLVVFAAYAVAAVAVGLVLLWVLESPPELVPAVLALAGGVLVAAYVGYRAGTVRLVASLRARELPRKRAPELYRRLDRLVERMRVAEPPVLVADLGAANALSIGGPRRGAVVLDRRLFRVLDTDELEAILAHELAHMEGYDTFLNTLALTAARTGAALVTLAFLPVALVFAGADRAAGWFVGRPGVRPGLDRLFRRGLVAVLGVVFGLFALAYFAYSRRQEYVADRRAAAVTGQPVTLARALERIHRANDPRSGLLSVLYTHEERDRHHLLSTHPPLDRRVDRLLELQADRPRA